jgi:formylglycine-generating enzyme required for sulfatase activity/TolB-like protein
MRRNIENIQVNYNTRKIVLSSFPGTSEILMTIKRASSVLLSFAFAFVILATSCYGDFKKTKIAVLDFELRGDTFTTKDMGGIVAEWFTTSMVQDGRFEVVERALLRKIVDEQKLGMTGLIDESSSAQLGKILGVKTIISGSVLQFQDTIEVNARIINVNTGSIVAAENIRSKTSENLKEVIELLTTRIVKNFPLTGYVVKKRGDSVLIDLGATSSLQLGMEFVVFKEGEVIKHPKTGEVLEVEQIHTGKVKITEISTNTATAEIISEEPGRKIAYGQLVQSIRRQEAPAEKSTPQLTDQKSIPGQETPADPAPEQGPTGERDNLASGGQGPPFLPLPTGTFMMGSNRFPEKPSHYVNIDKPVQMMMTEVTFEEFEKFCVETGFPFPDDSRWGRKDHPVINVTWNDAQAYAKWLTEQTGVTYRLPFETEWEWAAGAGSGTIYAWGNSLLPDMANCKGCGAIGEKHQSSPVRSFRPNKSGFFDMTGNVWEWVQDCWVENYADAPDDQSPRKYSGKCGNYTIRGGAWNSKEKQITVTSRLGVWVDTKSNYIGFRLVRDPNNLLQAEASPHKTENIGRPKSAASIGANLTGNNPGRSAGPRFSSMGSEK